MNVGLKVLKNIGGGTLLAYTLDSATCLFSTPYSLLCRWIEMLPMAALLQNIHDAQFVSQ